MDREHVVLCIMGKTASGKDTLVNKLCERTGLRPVISYTTRERRVNEGNTHIFITDKEYQELEDSGRIATFTQIGQYRYCCTIDQLYESDVYVIDPIGVQNLRKLNLPNLRLVTVYINTPDDVRKERALSKRGDDRLTFMKRDMAERDQFRSMLRNADFDYSISNINVGRAYSVLRWVATVEGLWQQRDKEGMMKDE